MKATKRIRPEVAAKIIARMFAERWSLEEVAAFLDLWYRGGRLDTILKWTADPENEAEARVDRFLRKYFEI